MGLFKKIFRRSKCKVKKTDDVGAYCLHEWCLFTNVFKIVA